MSKEDAEKLVLYAYLLSGAPSVTPEQYAYHAPRMQQDSGYAAALLKQLYDGQDFKQFSYRASRYEKDLADARASAGSGEAEKRLQSIKDALGIK